MWTGWDGNEEREDSERCALHLSSAVWADVRKYLCEKREGGWRKICAFATLEQKRF